MKNILISRTDGIGDVVLTLPLAGYLKKHLPGVNVHFLGTSYTKPVINRSEYISNFIDWNYIESLSPKEKVDFIRALEIDAIIHVFPRKEIASLAKAARIPVRIGTSRRLFHFTTCNKLVNLSRKNSSLHEAQLNFKLLSPLGFKTLPELIEIPEYYGIKNQSHSLKNPELTNSKLNLIIHPRTKGHAREWGLSNYEKLIKNLSSEKYRIFITGTQEESASLQPLIKNAGEKIVDLTGKQTLDELIDLICSADGIVANSTGPLHLAAASGKAAIGLYPPIRPVHPGRWAPLGPFARYIVAKRECSKCRKSSECDCILKIQPSEVSILLEKTLAEYRSVNAAANEFKRQNQNF